MHSGGHTLCEERWRPLKLLSGKASKGKSINKPFGVLADCNAFYKGDDDRVEVCCDMETLGEHKLLLDFIVSRLRVWTEVVSIG